jgi:hypothetical protein
VLSLLEHLVKAEAVPYVVAAIAKEVQKIQSDGDEASIEFRGMLL